MLLITLTLFILGGVGGQLGPPTWNWIRVTLVLTVAIGLFIVATVPDHFLETHLWEHVAKVHVPRVFAWTFGALLLMHVLVDHLHLAGWMQENRALLLLASSVVQDGHGMLPMLADSRWDFFRVKAINFTFGLGLGFIGYFSGW